MNKLMKIGFFVMFVFLINVVDNFAQTSIDESGFNRFDLDDDNVCDWEESSTKYDGFNEENFKQLRSICTLTRFGDMCDDTPKDASGIDRGSDSETSGCSRDQRENYFDYWHIDPNGELNPKSLKMNWLLDQNRGMNVYKYIKLEPNTVLEESKGEVIVDRLTPFCTDVTEYTGSHRRYINSFQSVDVNDDKKDTTLKISFRQLNPDEIGAINILDNPGDVYRKAGDPSHIVREVIVECEIRIHQHRVLEDGRRSSFYEKDEFTFYIPIESLVVEPPEQALTYAITVADQMVDRSDDLLKIFDKARIAVAGGCVTSATLLLTSSALRTVLAPIPLVNVFSEGLYKYAKTWWRGLGDENIFSVGTTTNQKGDEVLGGGGWIGGKAMCRYYTCPTEWCPAMQQGFYPITDGNRITDWRKVTSDTTDENFGNAETLASVFDRENKYIQDNLLMSVRCGCVTGIQQNLMYINVIFKEFERCLKAARQNKQYSSVCEQYLRQNVCEYVVRQGTDHLAGDLLGSALGKLGSGFSSGLGSILPESEALQSENIRQESEKGFKKIRNDFESEGLSDITRSHARGTMGYKAISTERLICETAIYGKLPKFDIITSFQEELGLPWKTNFHTSFNSKPVGNDEFGNPLYNLEVSWFLVAGEANFCYKLFLEDESGSRKDIPTPLEPGGEKKTIGKKCLGEAGDYNADFTELIDTRDYDKVCFEFDKEVPKKQCFPKGFHSSVLEIENIQMDDDADDKDGDGLPNWWEERYNCLPEMSSWSEDDFAEAKIDGESCLRLLNNGGYNKLNPDSRDSDGDGVGDDKENPDDDAYDNFHEYDNNLNPLISGETISGGSVLEDCNVNFNEFIIVGQEESENHIPVFRIGEEVVLKVDGTVIAYEEGRELDPENMAIEYEISGPDFYEPEFAEWNDAKKGVKILDVTEDLKTGTYVLKLEVILEKGIRESKCVNAKDNYKRIYEEIKIIILNDKKPGCVDSDGGMRDIGGTCYDANGVEKKDICDDGQLKEFSCSSEGECALSTGLSCSGSQECVNNPETSLGACVTKCVAYPERGLCIETKEDGNKINNYSECVDNNVVNYKCEQGKCVQDLMTKRDCGTTICYKDILNENIKAVCASNKCFDSDVIYGNEDIKFSKGINENEFGGILLINLDGGMTLQGDKCGDSTTLWEAYCGENGEYKAESIMCSNSCVEDKFNLKYYPLNINERIDSAKCT